MADLLISIFNDLRVMEGGRPTLWGNTGPTTMTWGVDNWGYNSEDMIQEVDKLITGTLGSDAAITLRELDHFLANSIGISSDITAGFLTNGIWSTVFPGGVTNAEDRISTSYTSAAITSTYNAVSPPTTNWL